MHASGPRPSQVLRLGLLRTGLLVVAGLTLAFSGFAVRPAAATSVAPLEVALGEHRFGRLHRPDAIVARAGAGGVGFESPPPGADGLAYGPWSFDVAADGSIWLLDEIRQRLLMWRPGRPDRPARAVALPEDPLDRVADFAVAPSGAIYASYVPPPGTERKTMRLAALDPDGRVRWTADTEVEIFNAPLRFGPDATLYSVDPGTLRWTPLATPAGRPVSLAEQRRRATSRQPLPGGRTLAAKMASPQRWDVVLGDRSGRPARAWRITSRTQLGAIVGTPALVGGDPVVILELSRQTATRHLYEHQVLRLAPDGGTSARFTLDPRAAWGDTPITGVRVGPDGHLYQLRTDPRAGVTIARHDLAAAERPAPPTTSPGPASGSGSGAGSDTPKVTAPPPTLPPAPDEPVAAPPTLDASPTADGTTRRLLPGLAALVAAVLLAGFAWRLYNRDHPADTGGRG